MGFEDEVEQSFGRPCRRTDGRFKHTYELTSSIVPRGNRLAQARPSNSRSESGAVGVTRISAAVTDDDRGEKVKIRLL
jgi:hypothetical protein